MPSWIPMTKEFFITYSEFFRFPAILYEKLWYLNVLSGISSFFSTPHNTFILIHDYRQPNNTYRGYEFVEKYLDIIEHVDSLYVFKKKQNIDLSEIEIYNLIPN